MISKSVDASFLDAYLASILHATRDLNMSGMSDMPDMLRCARHVGHKSRPHHPLRHSGFQHVRHPLRQRYPKTISTCQTRISTCQRMSQPHCSVSFPEILVVVDQTRSSDLIFFFFSDSKLFSERSILFSRNLLLKDHHGLKMANIFFGLLLHIILLSRQVLV